MRESASQQITRMTDAYLALPPVPHQTNDATAIRRAFRNAFLDGFTNPGAQLSSSNNATFYGFLEGQGFRSQHSEMEKEVMESFGYTPISIRGTLFFGRDFGFSPDGRPNDRWEVADPVLSEDGWPAIAARKDGMKVILSGYLSPEQYHEQRFIGDIKIYVTKTEILAS
jgi:hypothetical protein